MQPQLQVLCLVFLCVFFSFLEVTLAFLSSSPSQVSTPSLKSVYHSQPPRQSVKAGGRERIKNSTFTKIYNKRPESGTGFGSSSAKNSASLNTGEKSRQQDHQKQQNQALPPKFQMAYTCNRCETRNLITIDREAYTNGIVIAVCKGCESKHLVADNEKKLDMNGTQDNYRNIEELLASRGRSGEIKRVNMNDIKSHENPNSKLEDMDLEFNEEDGVVTLKPHVLKENKKIKDAVMKQLKEEEQKNQDNSDNQS